MLEACDRDTIATAARLGLPPRYDVIVLPDGHPRTKPRALNAALEAARGDLVVVYDAEDRPDPGQLRAAAARFAAAPADLACLQARLTIDHADETWITRGMMAQTPQAFQLCRRYLGVGARVVRAHGAPPLIAGANGSETCMVEELLIRSNRRRTP